MPDHEALLHTAFLQWGYLTARQAAAFGFSRQLCHHYCRKGSWVRVARSVYRVRAVPEQPDEDLARVNALVRDRHGRQAGVLSHHTALYVHGMLEKRPDRIHLSLDPMAQALEPEGVVVFRRRIDLPWMAAGLPRGTVATHDARERWVEPWRPYAATGGVRPTGTPPLPAEDIEDRGGFRVTAPLRSVLDAMTYRHHHDLSDVIDRGLRLGLFDLVDLLRGTEGMLRLPGERALWELLRAVRLRAREVERDLQTIRLRILAVRHHNEQHFGPAWVRSEAEDELGMEDGDGEDEPLDPTHDPAGPDLSTYRFTIEDAELRGTLAPESVTGSRSAEE